MIYLKTALLLLSITILTSCSDQKSISEQKLTKQWVKGNLHTHSYWSDGDEFPEVIMEWYKSNDYQFIALSDHNILAEGDKWIILSEDSIYQNAFRDYLDNYGSKWVDHKKDSLGRILVKLKTYDEYKVRFEEEGKFLIIRSE